MPLVTLSVPQKKLPQLHDFLTSIGIETARAKGLENIKPQQKASSTKDTSSSVFKKFFSWEYFSNELEFE